MRTSEPSVLFGLLAHGLGDYYAAVLLFILIIEGGLELPIRCSIRDLALKHLGGKTLASQLQRAGRRLERAAVLRRHVHPNHWTEFRIDVAATCALLEAGSHTPVFNRPLSSAAMALVASALAGGIQQTSAASRSLPPLPHTTEHSQGA